MKHSQNQNFLKVHTGLIPHRWKNKVHDCLFTTRMGEIKPIHWEHVQVGDTVSDRINTYTRTAPIEAPIFSNVHQTHRVYAVPMRKLMPDFEEFRMSNPSDNKLYVYTTFWDCVQALSSLGRGNFTQNGTIEEFIGLPNVFRNFILYVNHDSGTQVLDPDNFIYGNALSLVTLHYSDSSQAYYDVAHDLFDYRFSLVPFLAYKKIVFDWYRDKRFIADEFEFLYEQLDSLTNYPYITSSDTFTINWNGQTVTRNVLAWLLNEEFVEYPKDYFTTCGDGSQQGPDLVLGPQKLDIYGSVATQTTGNQFQTVVGTPDNFISADTPISRQRQYNVAHYTDPDAQLPNGLNYKVGDVWAEVNNADLITPVKLRYQMALQRNLERKNSAGPEYSDFIFGQIGIRIPDQYLRKSVYMGGTRAAIVCDEVIATSDGSANSISSNLGEFAARGAFRNSSRGIRAFLNEDVVVMTVSFIQPQQYYWQGLPKKLSALDNLSIPHPDFQNVGEEPVLNSELFLADDPDGIFGYNFRYAAQQVAMDEIHGDFRGNLAYWHTGRDMPYRPSLGHGFMRVQPGDHNRIFAYTGSRGMPFYCFTRHYFYHKMPLRNTQAEGRIG